jgi:predicted phage tail protein
MKKLGFTVLSTVLAIFMVFGIVIAAEKISGKVTEVDEAKRAITVDKDKNMETADDKATIEVTDVEENKKGWREVKKVNRVVECEVEVKDGKNIAVPGTCVKLEGAPGC